ncbi:phospholipase/carboxylesterase [Entomortierella parvispora]|uniref:Phospholipase/carboxylesterase n=1 Tax=Entomortierella parvispora TaxID=205924 RepID=A0A9P3HGB6_9FUNG|nr:phospholipase/carboxylesterase [Entomortierella parvispora]
MSSTKPPCFVCATPSITRCSQCKVIHYCSSACQRKDWPRHKVACTPAGKPSPTLESATTTTTTTTSNKGSTSSTSTKIPVDPSKPLKLTPVEHDPSSDLKPEPLASSTKLKFKFEHSQDGIDLNLLIFFHGLGDKIEPNFVQLAKSLNLPQTATVCIQAPTAVPFLEEAGWQWFPSFNIMTGELLGPEHKERITQVKQVVRPELVKFVQHCIDHSKFPANNIMLFGFSQGAQIALDLAAFGGIPLRGVVSIAGYMMEESENEEPANKKSMTKILVMQGDKDDLRSVKDAKEKLKHLERIFGKANVQQLIVDGMGHGMPNSEAGWRPLMEFFAMSLHHRAIAMEKMADVYEVK